MSGDLYPQVRAEQSVADWIEAHGEELELAGGVLPDEILGLIDANDDEFKARTETLVQTMKNLTAMAEVAGAESIRLRKLAASRKAKAETIERNMLRAMQDTGRAKVETELCDVRRTRGRVTVRLTDPDADVPERFRRAKYELDKPLAKKCWEHMAPDDPGVVEIEGEGITLERKEQLRIK